MYGLSRRQMYWAEKIVARVKSKGHSGDVGLRAADIALATALTESALWMYANRHNPTSLNLPHDKVGGDHGSVGLFQQQVGGATNSTANWGTTRELMDVNISTDKFLDALFNRSWKGRTNGQLAQSVQGSAFPDRYAEYDSWSVGLRKALWDDAEEAEDSKPEVSEDTKKRQAWMNRSRNEDLAVDGIRGPKTIAAIKRYQRFLKKGYGYSGAIDGIWGNGTQSAHQRYYDKVTAKKSKPKHPTLRRGSKGAAVKRVQKHLRDVYPLYAHDLAVDGIFGPGTEAAVKEFQRRSGITADGIVGKNTWAKLGI